MNGTLLALALALMAPAPKDVPKKDNATLTGTWVGVAAEGTNVPAQDLDKLRLEFKDGGLHIYDPTINRAIQATFTLNTTDKIAAIDITVGDLGAKEFVIQGIYRITGDKLEFCFNKGGKGGRPTEFKGDAAKDISFITLKRIPVEKKP